MKKLISIVVLMASSIVVNAQQQSIHRCYSDEIHQLKYNTDTEYRTNFDASQLRVDKVLSELKNKKPPSPPPYTIPVVVHVIHNNGAENISDAQIQSQISVLNDDFRKNTGTRGDGAGVDTEIEFCMATIDPNGDPTNGITRTVSSTYTDLNINTEDGGLKSLIHWDETMYLNFYIVQRICDGGSCGILGYAYFTNAGAIDGVVCGYNYYGTSDLDDGSFSLSPPYDLGRTMTHEVGHWVNLYHTFQSGCTNNTCTGQGDRVCDTPPVSSPNFGCPTGTNSCTTDNNDGSYPFPDVDDYIDDYMDYTDDACMSRYTQGQADRAIAALVANNPNIYSTANLLATGCATTLSNKFSSINIRQFTNQNVITWECDIDRSLSHFEIERGESGLNFEQIGSTTSNKFIDSNPKGGIQYYRVKAVNEYTNEVSYSKIIRTENIKLNPLKVYPNPFNERISLNITSAEIQTVKIFDVYGKLISTLNSTNVINTQSLSKGIYFLEVEYSGTKEVKRIIKE